MEHVWSKAESDIKYSTFFFDDKDSSDSESDTASESSSDEFNDLDSSFKIEFEGIDSPPCSFDGGDEISLDLVEDASRNDSLLDASILSQDESDDLWNCFMSCRETFPGISFVDSTKTKRLSFNPNLSPLDEESENVSESCSESTDSVPLKKPTKVRFRDEVVVHPLVVWAFAYKQARVSTWERIARDSRRFKHRTEIVEQDIGWCFDSIHRRNIYNSRFKSTHVRP